MDSVINSFFNTIESGLIMPVANGIWGILPVILYVAIGITLVSVAFSSSMQKGQKIAGIIHVAIMLAFMLTIFVISCKEVPRFSMMETSPALRISMFIPKSSILFGSGIISFQLLWKLADSILGVKEDEANG